MRLFSMMDGLLRDPDSVCRVDLAGKDLGKLCARLLLIFVITSALYGAAMGCFRWIHPEYFFSDFELYTPDGAAVCGDVAGVSFEKRTVYTASLDLPEAEDARIRFNLTRPSDPYEVESIGEEKGYGAIVLAPDSVLREAGAWKTPLLVAVKTPLLFVLTLAICAMALYVLNLAFEIRLHFLPVMTTLAFGLAATGVMLGVLVPITGLFSVVTADYHFMKVLHLLAFSVAGAFGVKVLYRGLVRFAPEGARGVWSLVVVWLVLYCVVGGQVAWTLKPFLGTPYLPATPPFRLERGNIYVSFFSSLSQVTSPRRDARSEQPGFAQPASYAPAPPRDGATTQSAADSDPSDGPPLDAGAAAAGTDPPDLVAVAP
jgi:hypothetical protein